MPGYRNNLAFHPTRGLTPQSETSESDDQQPLRTEEGPRAHACEPRADANNQNEFTVRTRPPRRPGRRGARGWSRSVAGRRWPERRTPPPRGRKRPRNLRFVGHQSLVGKHLEDAIAQDRRHHRPEERRNVREPQGVSKTERLASPKGSNPLKLAFEPFENDRNNMIAMNMSAMVSRPRHRRCHPPRTDRFDSLARTTRHRSLIVKAQFVNRRH